VTDKQRLREHTDDDGHYDIRAFAPCSVEVEPNPESLPPRVFLSADAPISGIVNPMRRASMRTLARFAELLGLPETAAMLRLIADPVASFWQSPD